MILVDRSALELRVLISATLFAMGCSAAAVPPESAPVPATAVTGELPLKHAPRPTSPAITPRDLMTRVYILADDSMLGRRAGAIGGAKGTAYIAAELARIGLEPAGENGTYYQEIPLRRRGVDSASTLSVDGAALSLWTDFIPLPEFDGSAFGGTVRLEGVQAIYGGRLGDTDNLITPAQAEGKLVVLAARRTADGRTIPSIGDEANQRYGKAAAVAFTTLDVTGPSLLNYLRQWRTGMSSDDSPRARAGSFLISNAGAAKLMGAPLESLRPGTLGKMVRADMKHGEMPTAAPARNVVAILRGSDAALRHQYVAIGSHNDHVGVRAQPIDHDSLKAFNMVLRKQGAEESPRPATPDDIARVRQMIDSMRALRPPRPDTVFNGADDDASGTAGMLEIAEAVAAMRPAPKRSILFVWHTAEELGLLGATHFTDHPTVPRDSIVAQLNLDMIGRGSAADSPEGGPGYVQVLGPRRLSSELAALVESVNTTGRHGLNFDYQFDADGHPLQFYCRSDHERYARYGIPIAFFSTGSHPDYHMLTDEPQYINYNRLAQVSNYVRDLAVTVANLDHRLVVDKPKPNPLASCRQ